jgi:predicted transcriptional regulator
VSEHNGNDLTKSKLYTLYLLVKQCPAAESKEFSVRLKRPMASVCADLKTLFNRGLVSRSPVRALPTGRPVYGYTATNKPYPVTKSPKGTKSSARHRKLDTSAASKTMVSGLDDALDAMALALATDLAVRVRKLLPGLLSPPPVALSPPKPPEVLPASEDTSQALFTPATPPQLPAVKDPPAKAQEKILIVGLMPIQAGELSTIFCHSFDLRFWNGKHPDDTLRGLTRSCDRIYIHTRHSSHQIQNTITSVGKTPILIRGGVSSMKQALKDRWDALQFLNGTKK